MIHSWVYLGLTDWCLDEIGADKSHDEGVRSHRSLKSISIPINIVTLADGEWSRDTERRPHSVTNNRQEEYFINLKLKTLFCNPGAEETEAAPAARRVTTLWMSPHPGGQKSEIYLFMVGVKLKKSNWHQNGLIQLKHNLLYGTRIFNNHLEQSYLPLLLIILSITDDISEKSFVLLGMTESWKNPIKTLPLAVIREASDSGLVHLAPRNNINCSIVILNILQKKWFRTCEEVAKTQEQQQQLWQ